MSIEAAPNAAQSESWNGDNGRRWVAQADQRDAILAPVADVLFGALTLEPGDRVLDIGCGCGVTSLRAAALVGEAGSVTGVDISTPMLEVARARSSRQGPRITTFAEGDAQVFPFAAGAFDAVISRFGTMFFADPVAAFTNIGSALRPGGRLTIATWQPLLVNDWLMVPGAALLQHAPMPAADPTAPGMFAQSDAETVTAALTAAGFVDIALDPVTVTFTLGESVDAAIAYLSEVGAARLLLDAIPAGPATDAAMADVRAALEPHLGPTGVRLDGAVWLVTAERPAR
jgi:SAM-dependent methyltransferase